MKSPEKKIVIGKEKIESEKDRYVEKRINQIAKWNGELVKYRKIKNRSRTEEASIRRPWA